MLLKKKEGRIESVRSDDRQVAELRQQSSTLVIHPGGDQSTNFLSVYGDLPAITEDIPREVIRKQIEQSERTIVMGHGVPQGLIGFGRLWIENSYVDLFKSQPNNIYIFCNADCFLRHHGLRGFATGMFISETAEARIFGVRASFKEIEESNKLFARIISESLELTPNQLKQKILNQYILPLNDVVLYNRKRMFSF
ncbi:MAG: hypothetical protein ABIP78_03840 [Pyrinomonadaceae bacterium]